MHHLAVTGTLRALQAARVDLNLARSLVWILSWAWLIRRLTFSQVDPEGTPASGLAFSDSRLTFFACAWGERMDPSYLGSVSCDAWSEDGNEGLSQEPPLKVAW